MRDLKSEELRLKETIKKANEQASILDKVMQNIEVIRQENFRLKEENTKLERRNTLLKEEITANETIFQNDVKQTQIQKGYLKDLVLELQKKLDALSIEYLGISEKRKEIDSVALELNQLKEKVSYLLEEKYKLTKDILKIKLGEFI